MGEISGLAPHHLDHRGLRPLHQLDQQRIAAVLRLVASSRSSAPTSGRGDWFRVRNVTAVEFQKSRLLSREWASITVRFVTVTPVTHKPSLAPASLPGLFSLLAVVGGAGSSGNLLPPSPPAEKATARQDQAGKSCAR
jgi:hypothetical protein